MEPSVPKLFWALRHHLMNKLPLRLPMRRDNTSEVINCWDWFYLWEFSRKRWVGRDLMLKRKGLVLKPDVLGRLLLL